MVGPDGFASLIRRRPTAMSSTTFSVQRPLRPLRRRRAHRSRLDSLAATCVAINVGRKPSETKTPLANHAEGH